MGIPVDQQNCSVGDTGILFGPYQETSDGFELQFATNYLGHFLLTHLLLPELKKAGSQASHSRIINVSSCAHVLGEIHFEDINLKKLYVPGDGYSQSKLGQILFTNYLDNLLVNKEKENVQVHSVHPGVTNTDMLKETYWKKFIPGLVNILFKSPQKAALPIIHACLSPDLEGKGGTYIMDCKVYPASSKAEDTKLQEEFFEHSKNLIHIDVFSRLA